MSMFDKYFNSPAPVEPVRVEPPKPELSIVQRMMTLVVHTDDDYEAATGYIKQIKSIVDDINKKWNPLVKKAHESHKALKDQQNAAVKPLEEAEAHLRKEITAFANKKESERREAERKIREAQESERRRLQEEAERARREQAEKERIAREEADRLAAAGNAEEAERARETALQEARRGEIVYQQHMDLAATIPAASVSSSTPKVDGISYITEYLAEVVDEAAVPVKFNDALIRPVDMKMVNALVKTYKGQISIPGIKITESKSPRVR